MNSFASTPMPANTRFSRASALMQRAMTAALLTAVAWVMMSALNPAHGQGQATGQREKFRRHEEAIPNRYIVVLRDEAAGAKGAKSQAAPLSAAMAKVAGGRVEHVFTHALNGFSIEMTEAAAQALARDPRVAYVEEDVRVYLTDTQQQATWGLDRVNQRHRALDGNYTYNATGAGVNVYVIDSGIRPTHQEFGGRATVAFDAVDDGQNGIDCLGHGTHVAGTIGGTTYGIAKRARLHAVRVFSCVREGRGAWILAGIDWVTRHHVKPAVANMSLGLMGTSEIVDEAVRNSIAAGITYVVAAGNKNQDACGYSPSRISEAITVGSTTDADTRRFDSNYGSCVDIFAPGNDITSAGMAHDTATEVMGGTSMAAPHVAGVAALILERNRTATPAEVATTIISGATPDVLHGLGYGSPNRLLYSLVGGSSGGSDPCTNCARYSGYLAAGASADQPDGNYYYSGSYGYQQGWLSGPAGTDFDLFLWKWNGSKWEIVASAESSSSQEKIAYYGAPGYYIWEVYAYSGSGNYQFWLQRP
jgi:aqualysin 1